MKKRTAALSFLVAVAGFVAFQKYQASSSIIPTLVSSHKTFSTFEPHVKPGTKGTIRMPSSQIENDRASELQQEAMKNYPSKDQIESKLKKLGFENYTLLKQPNGRIRVITKAEQLSTEDSNRNFEEKWALLEPQLVSMVNKENVKLSETDKDVIRQWRVTIDDTPTVSHP